MTGKSTKRQGFTLTEEDQKSLRDILAGREDDPRPGQRLIARRSALPGKERITGISLTSSTPSRKDLLGLSRRQRPLGEGHVKAASAISRVQKKGQVTIPKTFRDHLGISQGDSVMFDLVDNAVVIRPVAFSASLHAIEEVEQHLKDHNITVDDLNGVAEFIQERLFKEMYGDL